MKVMKIIFSFFLIFLCSCSSIRYNENISLQKIEGRKKVVVNYDSSRYRVVKLDSIIIDSGKTYYVKEGRYLLSYTEDTFISGYFGYSHKDRNDSLSDRKYISRKSLSIVDDMEINLKNHNVQINVIGKFNSDNKF